MIVYKFLRIPTFQGKQRWTQLQMWLLQLVLVFNLAVAAEDPLEESHKVEESSHSTTYHDLSKNITQDDDKATTTGKEKTTAQLVMQDESAIVLIGGNMDGRRSRSSVDVFRGRTLCPARTIPDLPENRHGLFSAFAADDESEVILVCGGRESLFDLDAKCWRYNLTRIGGNKSYNGLDDGTSSWERAASLPRSLAGAAVISLNGKVWVFGGVIEEDFYDMQKESEHYYYDYVIEEAGNGMMTYDIATDLWETKKPVLPQALQGACAVTWMGKFLLLGGHHDKDLPRGSREVWVFDPQEEKWSTDTWPYLSRKRYYHGCSIGVVNGRRGIIVAGGSAGQNSQEIVSTTVEFLPLDVANFAKNKSWSWRDLPELKTPHPNVPAVGFMDGLLTVIGGGGPPMAGGEDKVEIFDGKKWFSVSGLRMGRALGASVLVPKKWFPGCEMLPNMGVHRYHRERVQKMLSDNQWLCLGEELKTSSETRAILAEGCTVPGCNYPHFFRSQFNATSIIQSLRVRGGKLSCQLLGAGTINYRIECRLTCKEGWKNANNKDVTVCSPQQVAKFSSFSSSSPAIRVLRKATNFSTDYLECRRHMNPQKVVAKIALV